MGELEYASQNPPVDPWYCYVCELTFSSYEKYAIHKCICGEQMNNQTMTRRFYKTHSAIQRPQILRLYSEAVKEAEAEINKGTKEEYYIVEVRAVVRKQQPVQQPIEVIEVK